MTLVVAYAAGGGTDAIARGFAAQFEKELGGRVIVDNRPGAAGNMGTEVVAKADPDGYTLLIGNQGPMVVNPHIFKMRHDPAEALDPIAMIADAQLVIVVGPRLQVKSLPELLEKAKAEQLVYGSAGNASASHVATLLLGQSAGIELKHVPYKGAGPAVNDLVGGHIDFMVTTVPSVIGLIEVGTLTALAVTGAERFPRPARRPDRDRGRPSGLHRLGLVRHSRPEGHPRGRPRQDRGGDLGNAEEPRLPRQARDRRRRALRPRRPCLCRLHGRRAHPLGRGGQGRRHQGGVRDPDVRRTPHRRRARGGPPSSPWLGRERLAGLSLVGLGPLALWASSDLPFASEFGVSSGLVPRLLSLIILGLGLLQLYFSWSEPGRPTGSWRIHTMLPVVAAVVLFAVTIRGYEFGPVHVPELGLLVATPLAVIVSGLAAKDSKLPELLLFAAVLTVFCIGLFRYALGLSLPVAPWLIGY